MKEVFHQVRNLISKYNVGVTAIRPTATPKNEKVNEKQKSLKLSFKNMTSAKDQHSTVNFLRSSYK